MACFRWNMLAYRRELARALDFEKQRSHPSKIFKTHPFKCMSRDGKVDKGVDAHDRGRSQQVMYSSACVHVVQGGFSGECLF